MDETIECGWNRLWTTPKYLPRRDIPQYDNARAAEAIHQTLERELIKSRDFESRSPPSRNQ